MEKKIAISLLVLSLISCNKSLENKGPSSIDSVKLAEIAKTECTANQVLKPFLADLKIYTEPFPIPVFFAFSRGNDQCASLNNVDHGGLTTWLKIDYSDGCLPNGKIWSIDSFSKSDGDKIYLNLKSADSSETSWVHIFTSEGYSLQSLRNELGLIVFSCIDTNSK